MERVIPLFIHQLSRGEPITVYGGDDKVLDFTYIDDCIDGIARGIERLADGRVANETINLAYGQGNTLVRAAELIARRARRDAADHRSGPSLVGEVTRYVADIRKARELLGWQPATPLDEGIPRAVEWFRDWRAAHPEEDRPIVTERVPGEIEHDFKQPQSQVSEGGARDVVAIFGPTATGKSGRRAGAVGAARRRGRLRGLGGALRGHPGPDRRARATRRGSSGSCPLDDEVSVGEYQRLAHAAIDEILAAGRTPIVVGGTGLYLRAALVGLELPPPPAPGERERWSRLYDELGPEGAHALLAERDPAAAARVHPNDRRRVVRALELAEAGSSLAPARGHALGRRPAPSDAPRRARPRRTTSSTRGSRRASTRWSRAASSTEARRGVGATALGDRAEGARARGVRDPAAAERRPRRSSPRHAGSRATSASGCAGCRSPLRSHADRAPEEIADEIVALAGAGERLPRR